MTVFYLDPRSWQKTGMTVTPPRIDTARRPLTVGLLDNGFPDCGAFLDALEAVMASHLPGVRFRRVAKAVPADPLTASQSEQLSEGCHAVVAAFGH